MGMVQRGNRTSFALESGIKLLADDLDGDGAAQACIYRPKYFAHSAFAELALNTVPPQKLSFNHQGEGWLIEQVRSIPNGRLVQDIAAGVLGQH